MLTPEELLDVTGYDEDYVRVLRFFWENFKDDHRKGYLLKTYSLLTVPNALPELIKQDLRSIGTMSNQSRWLVYLSDLKLSAHEQWVDNGCVDNGRLIVQERNLSGASIPGANLIKAQFVKCNLSGANFRGSDLTSIELVECNLEDALLELSTLDKAIIKDCGFVGAYLNATSLKGVNFQGGDWSKVDLHRSDWTDATVQGTCFQKARFQGARLHKTRFTGCNLQAANLVAATAHDTVFDRCDFRRVDLGEFIVNNTIFYKCGFYNCTGIPKMEGKCEFVEPDLSEGFDGSRVVNEDKLFQLWGMKLYI